MAAIALRLAGNPHQINDPISDKMKGTKRLTQLMNFSIKAIYNWYRNSLRNPKYRGWIIFGTLAYLFSPFDISPDLFPIVGQIDDLALLTLFISEMSQVLIEGYKQRQVTTQTEASTSDATETVDVDAVPVQD